MFFHLPCYDDLLMVFFCLKLHNSATIKKSFSHPYLETATNISLSIFVQDKEKTHTLELKFSERKQPVLMKWIDWRKVGHSIKTLLEKREKQRGRNIETVVKQVIQFNIWRAGNVNGWQSSTTEPSHTGRIGDKSHCHTMTGSEINTQLTPAKSSYFALKVQSWF